MANALRVVFALFTPWERVQTIFLTNAVQLIFTACQYFMRIRLVANIPNQLIMWC